MNKYVSKLILVASLSFVTLGANAAILGEDYVVLDKPVPESAKTLTKIFSYDCPFCFKYAKAVDAPLMNKLGGIAFVPYHLKTKAKYGTIGSELLAVAIVDDQKAGLSPLDTSSKFHKVEMGLYNAYHTKKMRWSEGQDEFLNFGLELLGMNKSQFEKAKADPEVKTLLAKWDSAYEVAKIQGVPAYVVNGKYLLMTKKIKSLDAMATVIKELSNKEE